MKRSGRLRNGFTLVELLVVIGIIAVLVGILLPTIGRARKQANTVACMATLRMIGQTLCIYAIENKGSMPYGYYLSDIQSLNPNPSSIGESDPNTAVFVWWSVLRSYHRRNSSSDNGAQNSGASTSSRGMKGMTCPEGFGTDGSVHYAPNPVVMPDRQREMHPFVASVVNKPPGIPAKINQLYSDNIIMWDVTAIGPNFTSQYVTGYEVDSSPPGTMYKNGSMSDGKKAARRYRPMAAITYYLTPDIYNEVPIYPGRNTEIMPGTSAEGLRGNIRWRHGRNDSANFLFADGTVRNMKITTGTPGNADCKGEVLHSFLRIKPPSGFRPNG